MIAVRLQDLPAGEHVIPFAEWAKHMPQAPNYATPSVGSGIVLEGGGWSASVIAVDETTETCTVKVTGVYPK